MPENCSICACEIADDATPAVLDECIVCMDCHDKRRPTCPYCQSQLERRPQSLTPCPICGRVVHIRTKQSFFPSTILTKTQADRVDSYGVYATGRAALKEAEMEKAAGRKPAASRVINALKAEDDPARRAKQIDEMHLQAATDRQLKFASDVGLVLPEPTQWHASRLLTAYQELRYAIEAGWSEVHGREPETREVGRIVMSLVDDPEFRIIVKPNEFWVDLRLSEKAARRIKQVIRQVR